MAEQLLCAAPGASDLVARLASADGVAAHPHFAQLVVARAAPRDLGDAIHVLCAVHSTRPDLIEIVASTAAPGGASPWLEAALAGFAVERAILVQLTAAAGPLPSTPGQAQTAAALTAERHAMEMLARSERTGVGLGAAAALVLDWHALRAVLAAAANRFGASLPPTELPDTDATLRALDRSRAAERAIGFGAQQLFAQHRGLFSLLEARASARGRD